MSQINVDELNFLDSTSDEEPVKRPTTEYLHVPFHEKDIVKKLGAKWEPNVKKWYIPYNFKGDTACFKKWQIDKPIYYVTSDTRFKLSVVKDQTK